MTYWNKWFFGFFLVAGCTGDDGGDEGAGTGAGTGSSGDTAATTAPGDGAVTEEGGSSSEGGSDDATTTPADTTSDSMADSTDDGGSTDATSAESDSEGGSSSGGPPGATVSGTVFRDAGTPPGFGNDAIGDLYIGVLVACNANADSVASAFVEGADLSDSAVGVDYMAMDVPDGTYYVTGFLDDNENADPRDVNADQGDIAAAEGFGPACVEVTIVDGADVDGIDITLNFVVPF